LQHLLHLPCNAAASGRIASSCFKRVPALPGSTSFTTSGPFTSRACTARELHVYIIADKSALCHCHCQRLISDKGAAFWQQAVCATRWPPTCEPATCIDAHLRDPLLRRPRSSTHHPYWPSAPEHAPATRTRARPALAVMPAHAVPLVATFGWRPAVTALWRAVLHCRPRCRRVE
jgi:hypothetical protein